MSGITCDHVPYIPLLIRDVSSVELLQKYHQGIRSEIEARGAKFTDCIDLGKALLARKHRDSTEVSLQCKPTAFFFIHISAFKSLLSLDLITFLGAIGLPEKKKKNPFKFTGEPIKQTLIRNKKKSK